MEDKPYNQYLTVEDQFNIAMFNSMADQMSREQAIEFLKKSNHLLIATKRLYLMECARNLPVFDHESNQRPTEETLWTDGSPD